MQTKLRENAHTQRLILKTMLRGVEYTAKSIVALTGIKTAGAALSVMAKQRRIKRRKVDGEVLYKRQ